MRFVRRCPPNSLSARSPEVQSSSGVVGVVPGGVGSGLRVPAVLVTVLTVAGGSLVPGAALLSAGVHATSAVAASRPSTVVGIRW